jgi:hypothetical protein
MLSAAAARPKRAASGRLAPLATPHTSPAANVSPHPVASHDVSGDGGQSASLVGGGDEARGGTEGDHDRVDVGIEGGVGRAFSFRHPEAVLRCARLSSRTSISGSSSPIASRSIEGKGMTRSAVVVTPAARAVVSASRAH